MQPTMTHPTSVMADAAATAPVATRRPPLMQRAAAIPFNLIQRVGPAAAFFLHSYQIMGPVFRFQRNGHETVVLSGVEANLLMSAEGRHVLWSKDVRSAQNEELGIGRSMLSLNGDEHALWRKTQRRGYSKSALDARMDDAVACMRRHIAAWASGNTQADGEPVVVTSALNRLVADLLAIVITGQPSHPRYADASHFIGNFVNGSSAMGAHADMLAERAYIDSKARLFAWADDVIGQHAAAPAAPNQPPDLVDDLLAALNANPDLMTPQELRVAIAATPFIGGLDSTAATCAFLLHEVLRQPALLARIRAEVDAAFSDDGAVAHAALRECRALRQAVQETLRRYPIFPAIQGNAAQPFTFAGYDILAGDRLVIATTVPHMLDAHFPKPFEFDIDRFAAPRNEHLQPGAYVPFGLGEHACLGAGMAEGLVALMTAVLLHDAHIEAEQPDRPLNIVAHVVPSPDEHFRVRITHRRQA